MSRVIPGKNAVGERRSHHFSLMHDKNVLTGAFADVTVHVERDAFDVAIGHRFHANQL